MRFVFVGALLGLFLPAAPAAAQRDRDYHDYHREHARAYATAPEQLVAFWYRKFLGREPDAGLAGWATALRQGNSPEMVLAGILSSEEYYARGGTTPQGFVRELYRDIAGREPNRRELETLVRRTRLESRSDIAYSLLVRYPLSWRMTDDRRHDRDEHDYDYRRPERRYR